MLGRERVFEPFELLPELEEAKQVYCMLNLDTDSSSCFVLLDNKEAVQANKEAEEIGNRHRWVPCGEA